MMALNATALSIKFSLLSFVYLSSGKPLEYENWINDKPYKKHFWKDDKCVKSWPFHRRTKPVKGIEALSVHSWVCQK